MSNNKYCGNYLPNTGIKDGDSLRTLMLKIEQSFENSQGTPDTNGFYYILVKGLGTEQENGTELFEAYEEAKIMLSSVNNFDRVSVVVYPGTYSLPSQLELDTPGINLVSLTGNADVLLGREDIVSASPILINTSTINVVGIGVRPYMFGTLPSFEVSYDDSDTIVKNCFGGDNSFGVGNLNGQYIDCEGGNFSFAGTGNGSISGKFTGCVGGDNSFGGIANSAGGTFVNCTAGNDSFGLNANGRFTQCIAGTNSFGSVGTFTGKLYYSRLINGGLFPTVSGSGRTYYCIDGTGAENNQ